MYHCAKMKLKEQIITKRKTLFFVKQDNFYNNFLNKPEFKVP